MLFISVVGFAGFWTYCGPGMPFTGYTKKMTRLIGWEDLGQKVLSLAQEQGPATWVLGMDKHYTAAELSFYVARAAKSRNVPAPDVAGRAIVGISSLMFRYWVPESDLTGRDAVLVSRNRTDLEFPEVARAFESLGPITGSGVPETASPSASIITELVLHFAARR